MLEKIYNYFPQISDQQKSQLAALDGLYHLWNSQINVISRRDIDNLYLHHVLHSLAIAKVLQFLPGSKIIDIGTGGGFPGIPLAILFPQADFVLVDSIGKKVKVVQSITAELKLNNVKPLQDRVENLNERFDFAVSRAVARLDTVWGWAQPLISTDSKHNLPNGLLYLKGGDFEPELPKNIAIKHWPISNFFVEDYFKEKTLILLSDDK
ncbi:MAG TPA: 16S rRNA (guanine(527)-N(7))-methyltransferase RsmG [Patescibacteria group bacterium]|nr:16S rRNA (guanine(527)-N(7))-methyltransferase RsmG [Patescibacteria group bacterium]